MNSKNKLLTLRNDDDYFIEQWHERLFYDYHYREKFNIPFLSTKHLVIKVEYVKLWSREMIYIKRQQEPPEKKRKREIENAIKTQKGLI